MKMTVIHQSRTEEYVSTDELKVGDVVLHHGMRLKLIERFSRAYVKRDGVEVIWFTTECLNIEQIEADAKADRADNVWNSTPVFVLNAIRRDGHWSVQGNHLAYWWREVSESV